jgi:hypothetical protein
VVPVTELAGREKLCETRFPGELERKLVKGAGVIAIAGSVRGILDLTCAWALFKSKGGSLEKLLQFVASGAHGDLAFKSGRKGAAAGLLFHFSIAFAATTVYYVSSRSLPFLVSHAFASGIFYGALIHFFMSFVVLPLSRVKRKFSASGFFAQLAVHMFVVGLSISLIVSHFS